MPLDSDEAIRRALHHQLDVTGYIEDLAFYDEEEQDRAR